MIVHGWNDSSANQWQSWLARELEQKGYEVLAPSLPRPLAPNPRLWVSALEKAVGELGGEVVLVGHSLGVPTILRMLNDYPSEVRVAGVVLVAGFGDADSRVPAALFSPPLDFAKLRRRARRRVCIYSDNDYLVAPQRTQKLAQMLHAREVLSVGSGHFIGTPRYRGSIATLPVALREVEACYGFSWAKLLHYLIRLITHR